MELADGGEDDCSDCWPPVALPHAGHATIYQGWPLSGAERLAGWLWTIPSQRHNDVHGPDPARTGEMVLACPCCGSSHVHLSTITAITQDCTYEGFQDPPPVQAVILDPETAAVAEEPDLTAYRATSSNRGPIVTLGLWCEDGCLCYLELRPHKGRLFVAIRVIEAPEDAAALR